MSRPQGLPQPVQDWDFRYWTIGDGAAAARFEFEPKLAIYTTPAALCPSTWAQREQALQLSSWAVICSPPRQYYLPSPPPSFRRLCMASMQHLQ